MPDRTHEHAPWCARPAGGCFLGCVSRDLVVLADEGSQTAITTRLWTPRDRHCHMPVVVDLECRCGHRGTTWTATVSLPQAEHVARNMSDLVAMTRGGDSE